MPSPTRFPHDVPALSDGVVTLRAHALSDAADVVEQSTDELTQRFTRVPRGYTVEDARRFLADAVPGGWEHDLSWTFAVTASSSGAASGAANREGRYAGTVELRNEGNGRAEVAYVTHPWARGRALTERALRLLLEWAFTEKDVRTVIWWASRGNWPSRRLAWRLGFSCVGPVEQWLEMPDGLHDAWVGVLRAQDERSPRHPWQVPARIEGDGLALRAPVGKDVDAILVAFADPETRRWLRRLPEASSRAQTEDWLEVRRESMAVGQSLLWTVADTSDDGLLAMVTVFDIEDGVDGQLGYWTHPAARGRGVAQQACGLALRHCFVPAPDGGVGLSRVIANAAVGNLASRRVLDQRGFTQYAVERRGIEMGDGTRVDMACYDLLLEEWAEHASRSSPPE